MKKYKLVYKLAVMGIKQGPTFIPTNVHKGTLKELEKEMNKQVKALFKMAREVMPG